ncbi:terminase family protein [Salmonella enterica]|nr:terminase family protein [Salmonella enterica]
MDFSALREKLTPETLESMTPKALQALHDVIKPYLTYQKYNRIEFTNPFDYQDQFFQAGKTFKHRYLSAANRIGKSYGGAMEMSYHLTGRYPDNWKGREIKGSGRVYWCIGLNLTMVTDIQQKELLGTSNIGLTDEIGTGSIPRDCIELKQGLEKDGPRCVKIRIKHKDGGLNELAFFGSTDPDVLMGRKVAGVWMDEESPYSNEVYNQCIARIANGVEPGEDGFIFITATPEQGETPLYLKFAADKTGLLYIQRVTWWDSPLFNDTQIKELLAALDEHERDLRSKGIPAVGKGAVFKAPDDEIKVRDVYPLPHWQVIGAIDWGHVKDPTVIAICLHDPDNDVFYLYDLYYLDESEEARSPANVAKIILNSPYCGVPFLVPHDSGIKSEASESNGKLLQRLGVYVPPDPAMNPPETMLRNVKLGNKERNRFNVETGLSEMRFLMSLGKLKVCDNCDHWFREKHSYSYTYNDRTRTLGYAGADHCIDSSRYGFMGLISNRGCYWADAGKQAAYTPIENLPFTL